ncbi:MAG TPA: AAA family ATPase, partial [Polyangiales bacterium]|nr:AAA family ATPase [Polyangiales bacterium]
YRQELDGRSDLYALGATLYFTLVGRGAYPARTFQQLIELWQRPLVAPSEWVPSVPPALDALVMELLQLDPALRPVSAAEVSQRLCAVAGLENDEHLLISQAYLSTPTLVGRERALDRMAGMVQRTVRNRRGNAVLVRGAAGMGRSRFLDACALSAKLAGVTVLRTSPATAPNGPFAAAQALASQLLELLPDETLAAAAPQGQVLCQLLPALRSKLGRTSDRPSLDIQQQGQAALRGFLLEIASKRPLLIAIDDIERFDPDSRALVALLAHKAQANALLLVVASDKDAPDDGDDARMLTHAATLLTLEPLTVNETQALLASMFGDVPNLPTLVRRVHALAAGSPQNLMRLAQHLLDRGVVRFSSGAWILPDLIDDGDLPATMAQTFAAKVAELDPDARALAQVFAHYADQRFSFDDCIALHAQRDRARVFRSLDQLLAAGVLIASTDDYALGSPAWIAPLSSALDPELATRLSRVFLGRGEGLRAVRCLFLAGRESEGLDALVAYSQASHEQTSADSASYIKLLSTLPPDWIEIFERGLSLCAKLGRPARDEYAVRTRLSGIVSQNDVCSHGQQAAFAQRLAHDVGLDLYAALDPSLPPATRLQQALGAAAARYASTPEHDRVLDPKTAIGMLARTTIAAIGNFARTLDAAEWRQMPSVGPLAVLSPSVAVVDRLARGFEARLSGRFEDACIIYRETLKMLEAGNAGLDSTFADSMRAALPGIIGFIEAVLGLPSSERCADEVSKFPLYQGSALAIRLLDRLWQGDVIGADRIARERELWRLEQPRQQTSDVLTVLWTLQGHAASDDLTHARNDLQAIERTAAKVRTWLPVAAWARGEYERIRGDHASALIALDSALSRIDAGRHQLWPLAAGARLRVLCELGREEEARADGERYLSIALEHGLGYVSAYLRMPLALAHAKLGNAEAAWAHAQAAIEIFEGIGARGLHPGLAFETAARVAIALGDTASYERYAALCKQCFLAHPNPALAAKYQRLVRMSQRAAQAKADPAGAIPPGDSVLSRSQIESVLQGCTTRSERLQRVLQLLVMKAGAERGFLYGLSEGVPSLHARSDHVDPPPEVDQVALRYLEYEITRDAETATATADSEESNFSSHWTSGMRQCFVPVLLNHQAAQGFVISGLAVLMMDGNAAPRAVAETATQLSRFAVESGDLPAFVVG